MLGRDLDPDFDGQRRCVFCGNPIVIGEDVQIDIVAPAEKHSAALRFCSEACEIGFRSRTDQDYVELEDLHRSGAT